VTRPANPPLARRRHKKGERVNLTVRQPYLTHFKEQKMTKQLFVYLILILIGVSCDQAPSSSSNPAAPKAGTPSLTAPAPVYDPIQKWGKQKVASAKKVMALANQDCRIYEEDPHLVVEMRMYITDPNQRLGYVRAIVDSDVILHGQPRNIYFYDPSNKKIAQADTLNGVRLID